jgi:outer membrane protein OmpA-like peptidoglycan-associated protein
LYAVGPFAREDIESAVRERTRAGLDAAGFGWVKLQVSGQDVVLGGEQLAAGDGDRALALAREAACPSWAGPLLCAVAVTGRFSMTAAPPPPIAAPAPPPVVSAGDCERGLADIVARSEIEFATGSSQIQPQSSAVLDALAKTALGCPGVLLIQGHTDSTGSAGLNQGLSEARAAAVSQALAERGVPEERLRSRGFGADRPVADNATAAGRARNRRIEFHVVEAAPGRK